MQAWVIHVDIQWIPPNTSYTKYLTLGDSRKTIMGYSNKQHLWQKAILCISRLPSNMQYVGAPLSSYD